MQRAREEGRDKRSDVVLISSDPTLIKTVRTLVDPVAGLRLNVLAHAGDVSLHLERSEVSLVLIHLAARGVDAEAANVLQMVAASPRPVAALVLDDRDQPEQAAAVLRRGAVDCLSRPLDLARLAFFVNVLTIRARAAACPAASASTEELAEPTAVSATPASEMGRLMEQVRRVAPQETTLLLSGETGTGKTRLARLIHELSPRRGEPFLVINCGALSATLIESELFGHVRGAFTGADRERTGKLGEVGRGTLLLDEVDSLPPALQAKLLRAVEERVFEAVGSNKTQAVKARLIAASNRDLEREVAAGRFRSDLYYRLNVVGFTLPPLRERRETIESMAAQFLTDFASRNDCPVRTISPAVLRALKAYAWPGNIRELRNVIERAVALCSGDEIHLDDLPGAIRVDSIGGGPLAESGLDVPEAASPAPTLARTTEAAEAARIAEALEKHRNNRLRAAAELGISRMTLYKKLHKYAGLGWIESSRASVRAVSMRPYDAEESRLQEAGKAVLVAG